MALDTTHVPDALGCRNQERAEAAKSKLEKETGLKKFEILVIDIMKFSSVRSAVSGLEGSVDCLVLNAGGPGGKDFVAQTEDGVANIMALNVTGNALLFNELSEAGKLTKGSTVMYASSEAARGVASIGFPPPAIKDGSFDEFKSAIDGNMFTVDKTYETTYCWAKCVGCLWISSMARRNSDYRFVSVSPGMCTGTNLLNDLGFLKKTTFTILGPLLKLSGMGHGIDDGAGRYIDVVCKTDEYENGVFYGSELKKFTGRLVPQTDMFKDLANENYQDNADAAIQSFFS